MKKMIVLLAAMLLFSSVASAENIHLTWVNGVSNEDGLKVYSCSTSMGPCITILADLPPNATAWTDIDITEGVHHYRVTAYRGATLIHSGIFGTVHTPMTGTITGATATVVP